jgi:hypothetical protein
MTPSTLRVSTVNTAGSLFGTRIRGGRLLFRELWRRSDIIKQHGNSAIERQCYLRILACQRL